MTVLLAARGVARRFGDHVALHPTDLEVSAGEAVVPADAVRLAGAIGALFPVEHALRFFSAALYDASPWRTLAIESAWLVAITAALWALARLAARRLLL